MAAVLGISPWESARSLGDLMVGNRTAPPQTTEQGRGHYLEPSVVNWVFGQHPEWDRHPDSGRTFYRDGLDWAAVNPDALAVNRETGEIVPIEAKTDAGDDVGWGKPGSGHIPIYYAAQGMWTCHVLQLDWISFPLLGKRLEFGEYVLRYDPKIGSAMQRKGEEFLDILEAGRLPELDASIATYESIRSVTPDIDGTDHQLDPRLAIEYVDSLDALEAATDRHGLARNQVFDAMGAAKYAVTGEKKTRQTIASRSRKGQGRPFLLKSKRPLDRTLIGAS
nr:hypothetical protein [Nakamurella panacisegetis]